MQNEASGWNAEIYLLESRYIDTLWSEAVFVVRPFKAQWFRPSKRQLGKRIHGIVCWHVFHLRTLERLEGKVTKCIIILWADWNQNPKVGGPKLGKVCRVSGPVFLEWKKNQRVRCKKTFKNWLRVTGSKLNVSESDLKNGLLNIVFKKLKTLVLIQWCKYK